MNIEQFKNLVDGAINDFTDGVTDPKEFRDAILDILLKVAYPGGENKKETICYCDDCKRPLSKDDVLDMLELPRICPECMKK